MSIKNVSSENPLLSDASLADGLVREQMKKVLTSVGDADPGSVQHDDPSLRSQDCSRSTTVITNSAVKWLLKFETTSEMRDSQQINIALKRTHILISFREICINSTRIQFSFWILYPSLSALTEFLVITRFMYKKDWNSMTASSFQPIDVHCWA